MSTWPYQLLKTLCNEYASIITNFPSKIIYWKIESVIWLTRNQNGRHREQQQCERVRTVYSAAWYSESVAMTRSTFCSRNPSSSKSNWERWTEWTFSMQQIQCEQPQPLELKLRRQQEEEKQPFPLSLVDVSMDHGCSYWASDYLNWVLLGLYEQKQRLFLTKKLLLRTIPYCSVAQIQTSVEPGKCG